MTSISGFSFYRHATETTIHQSPRPQWNAPAEAAVSSCAEAAGDRLSVGAAHRASPKRGVLDGAYFTRETVHRGARRNRDRVGTCQRRGLPPTCFPPQARATTRTLRPGPLHSNPFSSFSAHTYSIFVRLAGYGTALWLCEEFSNLLNGCIIGIKLASRENRDAE